jgi:hypothetical protein
MHAACLTHLIVLGLIILLIFGEDHKLWGSSLRSFLQPSIIPSKYSPQRLGLKFPMFSP